MENLILIIFLFLVILVIIIIQKQDPEKVEQTYIGKTILVPYYSYFGYRWWYNWWPYYYGSGSSGGPNYYSTYRYHDKRRKHRHPRHKHIVKNNSKGSIIIRSPTIRRGVQNNSMKTSRHGSRIRNNFTNAQKKILITKATNKK